MCQKKAILDRIAAENKGDQRVGQMTTKDKNTDEEDQNNEDLFNHFGLQLGNSAPAQNKIEKIKSSDDKNSGANTPLIV